MKSFYRILVFFTMILSPLGVVHAQDLSGSAVLVEGTVRSQGLPGFLPNRIPALSGRYESSGGTSVRVWAVFEPLSFDPAYWQKSAMDKNSVWFRQTEDRNQVWCVMRTIAMRTGMEKYSRCVFVMSAGADVSEAQCRSFLADFVGRTEFFFSSANRAGDLSFPATLEIAGK